MESLAKYVHVSPMITFPYLCHYAFDIIHKLKGLLTSVNYSHISSGICNGLKDLAKDLGWIISSDLFVEGQNIAKQYKYIK